MYLGKARFPVAGAMLEYPLGNILPASKGLETNAVAHLIQVLSSLNKNNIIMHNEGY